MLQFLAKFLLSVSKVKEEALNWMGFTALDVLEHSPKDFKRFTFQNILMDAGVERANNQNNLPPPSATMIGHHESGKPTQLSKQRSSQFLYLKHKGHWIEEATTINAPRSCDCNDYLPTCAQSPQWSLANSGMPQSNM